MAKIHTLKKDGESIYPVTHISAVVDDNGNTVTELVDGKAGKDYVDDVIAQAITNTLNTEV